MLAQKPIEEETKHKVRVMWGNGLRAELWKPFVERFGIKRVGELYGSTEGNSNISEFTCYIFLAFIILIFGGKCVVLREMMRLNGLKIGAFDDGF